MKVEIDWRPYPKEKPTKFDEYLITLLDKRDNSLSVATDSFFPAEDFIDLDDGWAIYDESLCDFKVVAWAEMPKPFKE